MFVGLDKICWIKLCSLRCTCDTGYMYTYMVSYVNQIELKLQITWNQNNNNSDY